MEKRKTNYLKTDAIRFGFFVLLCLALSNCQQKEVPTAKQIVERSVEAHGGIDLWKNIKQLSFDPTTTLFNADSTRASKVEQFQLFSPQPELFGKIEWELDNQELSIIYDKGKVEKHINDSLVTNKEALQGASNSFFAAQYVINQPFALLDDGVKLTYLGIVELEETSAYQIKVTYPEDTENSNKWTYLIDTKTFEVIANKVELLDHTSWVENLTFDTTTNFKFNAHRKSYRLNDKGEKTYLRAEYFYTDFEVVYNNP
jgi:hypothetical protein